jgi:GxxExxY protein
MTRMTRIPSDHQTGDASPALPWAQLTRHIIGAFFDVYNELGYGFLENLYAPALAIVLHERGFRVAREVPLAVHFHGQQIGLYRADMIVDDAVILELKAGATLFPGSKAQLINYLRISGLQVGLVLFFGPTPEFTRVIASRRGHDGP